MRCVQRGIPTSLQAARERAGLTRCRLGELIGRHGATVGRWEAGTVAPQPAERLKLADLLGVALDDLFPCVEPAYLTAARRVVGSRTIPELRRAVVLLDEELKALDRASTERGSA